MTKIEQGLQAVKNYLYDNIGAMIAHFRFAPDPELNDLKGTMVP